MNVYVHAGVYVCMHLHVCVFVCMHMYIVYMVRVCVCVFICVHMETNMETRKQPWHNSSNILPTFSFSSPFFLFFFFLERFYHRLSQ